MSSHALGRWLKWPLVLAMALAFLFLVFNIYLTGHPFWALAVLAMVSVGFYIYLSNVAFAYRYLFPGLAGMALFVAFPLLYTVQIGFTNYSSNNLLSQERARAYLLEQTLPDEAQTLGYTLHADGDEFRIVLTPLHEPEDEADPEKLAQLQARSLLSTPLALRAASPPAQTEMLPLEKASFHINEPLPLKDVLRHRDVLMQLKLKLPDGRLLSYAGVREFGPLNAVWKANPDGSLTRAGTGETYAPNMKTGFFETPDGAQLQPGFKVNVGFANFVRMFSDPDFRGPFLSIFAWTLVFATLTVVFSLIIGMTLAVVLNWEALRFRTLYRTLLFLPYAVPGFISILVFKGLFNQNFGEINAILDALFGIKPAWFADPLLAKVMILIVNTWLGYPFIMVLCAGLIKAIPADLYEASAIAGAKPLTNFFKITAPLIVKPLMPLLISAFAYNFNNFVLIALLTNGRPDFLNTKIPAGTTDILVSYTYRIAFQDSGQNFGLAAAISTMIFFMVALLSLAHLRIARVNQDLK
ncbi:MAG: maltose ABC transporter permease MalF [Gammaproteobacteria bacterium]|nr:maltose ABC transporter permease MalF [Gammaproteobacteria bacterium]